MKLEPVITEKSTKLAEAGKFTFRVDIGLNKYQIKDLIEKVFSVHVTSVKTIKEHSEVKRTARGRKRIIKPQKKAIVTLREKEKIDLFETKKK
ncbi:MAG: 50S ribosomal protein L23 [Candidatus Woesebacteria bacterium GW2011_GWB1_39_12]|uniref:Large ribosomal subunit protein uL23 n=2 Tax=Candidatus Woeseibacteriota TaxID=1752722 RepID=A0A0G0PIG4_9BACT|nr:MAG: 50S ribosomal protein L23 [Candidatus Woesebacteria bacterium GW2011_GWB1_39_12]KKQ97904.1 MAG: 50S ribosomal protein L23 [Candidatus Woesebacteria bacterium GW2011_GWA1_39_12]